MFSCSFFFFFVLFLFFDCLCFALLDHIFNTYMRSLTSISFFPFCEFLPLVVIQESLGRRHTSARENARTLRGPIDIFLSAPFPSFSLFSFELNVWLLSWYIQSCDWLLSCRGRGGGGSAPPPYMNPNGVDLDRLHTHTHRLRVSFMFSLCLCASIRSYKSIKTYESITT